jgi:molecular chaperone Hsp33
MRVPLDGGSLYRSIVPLVSGEIGVDVATYLTQSAQIPSAVAVGVLVGPDASVLAAGGYLLQGMPGAETEALERLQASVERQPPPSELVRAGHGPLDILTRVLGDVPARVLDEREPRFRCRCSPDRVRGVILAMGRDEIVALIDEGAPAEAVCEFCNTAYTVSRDELGALLDSSYTTRPRPAPSACSGCSRSSASRTR